MRTRIAVTLMLAVATGLLATRARAGDRHRLDLSIVGTNIERDATGLPALLEGLVFFRGGPADGRIAGTYEETLEPRMDPELGLVGTIGESSFRFVKHEGAAVITEEVITRNRSSIVGEIPEDGALLVESTGRVIKGPQPHEATGTLRSRATVRLAPVFQLEVEVSLVFGEAGGTSPARAGETARAPETSLVMTLGASGRTELRYSQAFKKGVLRRLTGEGAVSPAALAAETGLSEPLLARWAQQARLLAMMRKMQSSLRPAEREWTFEEKLGVVLRTAGYSEAELDEFVALEGLTKETLATWRHAIERVVEAGIRSGKASDEEGGDPGEGEPEEAAAPLDLRDFEKLKKRVERLIEGSSGEDESEGVPQARPTGTETRPDASVTRKAERARTRH